MGSTVEEIGVPMGLSMGQGLAAGWRCRWTMAFRDPTSASSTSLGNQSTGEEKSNLTNSY